MLELAERDGYDAATVEQVADRAEVAVSTIYRYFANTDAILRQGRYAQNGAELHAMAELFSSQG
jgi:AcrR family transcriptional regulator